MSEPDFDKILSEYDIITSRAFYAEKNYREYYGDAHPVKDLDLTGEVIKKLYPEDYPVFVEVMAQTKYYFGNLCVTSKKIFDEYCQWLFGIFFELEKVIDLTGYDVYQTRIFGFLSEELLLVYIKARGLKCFESRIGVTEEKAETKELKLAISQLLKMGQLDDAIKQIEMQYMDNFITLYAESYDGEQRNELASLLRPNSYKKGKPFYFTSTELAGEYSLLTRGIED